MGTAVILKRWEDLDEGVDSNWEQLAQKIQWIQLKSGENTHNQANSEEGDGEVPPSKLAILWSNLSSTFVFIWKVSLLGH